MIVFDAASSGLNDGVSTATTISWTHVCTGSDLILIVAAMNRGGSDTSVSGITYNGVPLTRATGVNNSTTVGIDIWYLINPPTGSNTVQITWSVATFGIGAALSYSGAKQTGQPDNSVTATDVSTNNSPTTLDLTPASANCMVIDAHGITVSQHGTPNASQTERSDTVGVNHGMALFMSEKAVSTPVSTSMDYTAATGSPNWASVAISIASSFVPTPGTVDSIPSYDIRIQDQVIAY